MNTDKTNSGDKTAEKSVEKESEFVSSIYPESALTASIIEAAIAVHNALGSGFLEKVYENALAYELRQRGLACLQQHPLTVVYKGVIVGDYVADVLVENRVLVELKACTGLDNVHHAQVLNYLRASGIKVALLFNFGRPKLEYRRLVG